MLSLARGVNINKKIDVNKIFGIIWLKINENLNHIFSINKDILGERIPNPDIIKVTKSKFLFSRKKLKNNSPKTIVNTVK